MGTDSYWTCHSDHFIMYLLDRSVVHLKLTKSYINYTSIEIFLKEKK